MFFFDHDARDSRMPSQLSVQALGRPYQEMAEYLGKPLAERVQTDVPPLWKHPLHPTVLNALKRLSYDKCPFCERRVADLAPYRFRPPAYVVPAKEVSDKWSYLWLTFGWHNLFPICIECRPEKPEFFPVSGRRAKVPDLDGYAPTRLPEALAEGRIAEKAVLLYPAEEKLPNRSFEITLDGVLSGTKSRSKATITQFNLNRPDLIELRGEAIQNALDDLLSGRVPFLAGGFEREEFGGAVYLALRKVASELSPDYGRSASLVVDRLPSVFRSWSNRPTFRTDFGRALERIRSAELQASELPRDYWNDSAGFETGGALRSVRITNFKSIENVALDLPYRKRMDDSAACLLLLGENAAGKTSFLQAIALACLSPSDVSDLGLTPSSLVLDPRLLGGDGDWTPGHAGVELEFDRGERRLDIDGSSIDTGGSNPPELYAYGARRYFDDGVRRGPSRFVDTLFRADRKISNPEPWLVGLASRRPEVLGEVVSALRHIIQVDGEFSDIVVTGRSKDSAGSCHINIKKTSPNGETFILRQRLDAASSGYKAILALVCDVFCGLLKAEEADGSTGPEIARRARMRPALVLVDEIEAHLHPRWKLGIVAGLRAAFPNVTFIITSHDPLCVRGMRNGEVVVVNRFHSTGGRLPEAVEAVAEPGGFENMTVEQLLTSDLFQMYSTDDSRIDRAFAEVSVLLSRRDRLAPEEAETLRQFDEEIAAALPYGRSEVSQLVTEAVAEYLAVRRIADADTVNTARDRAKAEIRQFLEGLVE